MGVVIIILLVLAVIGEIIGESRGHAGAGFFLGLLLGPVGLLIIAVMDRTPEAEARYDKQVEAMGRESTPTLRTCPWCAEQIQPAAVVCKHCGRDVKADRTV